MNGWVVAKHENGLYFAGQLVQDANKTLRGKPAIQNFFLTNG